VKKRSLMLRSAKRPIPNLGALCHWFCRCRL